MARTIDTLSQSSAFQKPGSGWSVLRLLDALLIWQDRMAERAQLASLSDRELRDVGLSREQVGAELEKPFWSY